jgi:hypothetical protein
LQVQHIYLVLLVVVEAGRTAKRRVSRTALLFNKVTNLMNVPEQMPLVLNLSIQSVSDIMAKASTRPEAQPFSIARATREIAKYNKLQRTADISYHGERIAVQLQANQSSNYDATNCQLACLGMHGAASIPNLTSNSVFESKRMHLALGATICSTAC